MKNGNIHMQFSVLYCMISQGTQFLYKHYNYFYKKSPNTLPEWFGVWTYETIHCRHRISVLFDFIWNIDM